MASVYSTHSPVSRTAQVSVRLRMRTSFPSAHSPFTRFSKQRRKGGQLVPRALCPTHLSRSKCSSPVPPNAPISRQRSCECAIMLRMLRHRIDQPSSCSFLVHSLYISDTQGRMQWEGSSPSLCPADHSASILHSCPPFDCRSIQLCIIFFPIYPSSWVMWRRRIGQLEAPRHVARASWLGKGEGAWVLRWSASQENWYPLLHGPATSRMRVWACDPCTCYCDLERVNGMKRA
ncbi:hypothetical protein TIFTF001_031111 [Ficus carica]|uniref:Uncharacterized protein n=1 Tax=Ficus carica TaxID=3494 RepID=A0AA88DUI0_FICCA|nr:hypothetical protein TIFTF001_031111 [Ficus carica]